MINSRQILLLATFSGILSVALGAFGAHALKPLLLQNGKLETYELAVRYQFYHTLALLAIAILMDRIQVKSMEISGLLMFIGMVLFSGSLYIMALLNTTLVVMITPIGGVFLITGWTLFFYSIVKSKA